MRKMGIDMGTKKVGIALSDESGVMAFPHSILPNDKQLIKKLETLIVSEKVGEIIVGHSLDGEGAPNAVHSATEDLITDLTLATGLPIHLEPEQYSTQEAIRIQGRTQKTDAAAAAVILNSFIMRHK